MIAGTIKHGSSQKFIKFFLGVCLLLLLACTKEKDPFNRLISLYDEAINLYKKVKLENKDAYNELIDFWNSQRPQIEKIQEEIKKELRNANNQAAQETSAAQLIDLINKIYELKKVISEKEID